VTLRSSDNQIVRVSIIVPAFNEERLLAATLSSIRDAAGAFDQQGWSSEVIVCDNNSTDRTSEIALEAGARVVFEPLNQIARSRNAGAAYAGGEWLIFVDADCCPSPALFADVAQAIRRGRCLAGGSTVSLDGSHPLMSFGVSIWNLLSRINKWAAGSFIFCEASTFREVGGFNQAMYAGEEIDLFRRLKRVARLKDRAIVVLHQHPLRTSDRKARLYTSWELLTFFARTIASRGRTLRSAEACFAWYDGRR
jgi:glycosyltransferase involved in cell wall biosynthesis